MADVISDIINNTWSFIEKTIVNINRTLGLPPEVDIIAFFVTKAIILLLLLTLDLLFVIWMERKLLGRFHHRRSVTETGPAGFFQNIADGIKFIIKEDIIPAKADKFLHYATPILYILIALIPLALIPFAPGLVMANIDASFILALAILSLLPGIVILAGWAGGSKFSLIGAFRAGLMLVAYEIPLALAGISVILLAHSLSLEGIALAQKNIWFIILQPLGAFIFFIASIMELERGPFDITEAESELVVGWRTEYSGVKFMLFYGGQYIQLFVSASIFTILYLGAWYGPLFHPLVWFLIKVHVVIIFMVLVRITYFRPRPDQLVNIGFKWMIPLSIINLLATMLIMPYIIVYI